MNLRSQLRDQSRRRPLIRISANRHARTAVLVWRTEDTAANVLCGEISSSFRSLYRSCPVNTDSDLSNYLLELQRSGELADLSSIYILWVWNQTPPPDLEVILQSFEGQPRTFAADVCCIGSTVNVRTLGYRYEWRIGADTASDADTLAVLLTLASTTDIPLNPRTAGRVFHVQSTLHNAAEREI